jgi:hypothetical protein
MLKGILVDEAREGKLRFVFLVEDLKVFSRAFESF